MRRLLWLAILTSVPAVSRATATSAHLLEQRALSFPLAMRLQTDLPPPPPPEIDLPPPPPAPGEEEMPSLGRVLGFMITGGALMAGSVVFWFYGFYFLVALAPFGGSGGSAFATVGYVLVTIALAMVGAGLPLFLIGNAARVRRSAMRAGRAVSFGYDPATRAFTVGYTF